MHTFYRALSVFVAVLALSVPILVGEDNKEEKKEKEVKPKPEYPALETLVDGMAKKEGFFTVYQKQETLYALIKADQMQQPFYLAITLSGGIFAGMQWDDMVVYWEVQGKNLLLVRPDLRHRAPKSTLEDVVARTFPSAIIRAVPIMSKTASGDVLIDCDQIFKSDLAGVAQMSPFFLDRQANLNSSLCRWSKVKVFPYNVELGVEAAFTGPTVIGEPPNWSDYSDGERSQRMGIHYSLSFIPESDYKSRMADTRVGYFTTAVKDYSTKHDARTHFARYIQRWHLEKADPSLEMSPPKKPIVFHIENTVPYRFRKYVREGVLEWNKAFEKVGLVDAMVVRQQTDRDFIDLDPEDVRYNFIRWTTNDFGFAAGPSRVHPVTGEILDADIIFDDSMLRYDARMYSNYTPSAMLWEVDPKFKDLFDKFPNEKTAKRLNRLWQQDETADNPCAHGTPAPRREKPVGALSRVVEIMADRGRPLCMYGHGLKHQLHLAHVIARAEGKKQLPEEFVGTIIREIVMHEVGHTLGLYHNFKGSSWLPLAKINCQEKPEATSGSVMDYNPINFVPRGIPQGHYLPRTLGPYDYWAIEYGYKIADKDGEEKMLAAIARRAAEDGLAYGNDMYATLLDPDPLLIRWDFGNDPVAYARMRIELFDQLQKDIVDRVVAEGEDYHPVREAFDTLLADYFYTSMLTARYVGGQFLHWDHKGDPDRRPPLVVVPATKQKEALIFLANHIFSEKSFRFSPRTLQHLAPGVWWHWESDELNAWPSYPLHEEILWIQAITLFVLLNPVNLQRIHDSPLQVSPEEEVLTLADLLDTLTMVLWKEIDTPVEGKEWTDRDPFISSMRRNIQRLYLTIWINYFVLDNFILLVPEDARTMAWKNLDELTDKLKAVLEQSDLLDRASLAHLEESQVRIAEALKKWMMIE